MQPLLSQFNCIISKLKSNIRLKGIVLFLVAAFMFLYTFSIPAFSGRERIYLVSYGLMALFAFATLFYIFIFDNINFQKRHLIPLFFLAEALIGTIIYSHDFRRWLSLVLLMITMFIYYLAFCAIRKSRTSLKIITFAFLAFSIYFIFIYRNSIFHLNINDRIGTYFDNQNTVGSYFSLAFATSTYVAVMFEKKRDLLYLIPSGIFGLCGIFTGSRTFVLLVIVSTIVILFIRFRTNKLIFFIILGILMVLFFAAINLPIFSTLKTRIDQTLYTIFGIGNSKVDHSTVQRVLWQKYGYYLGSRNLLFGYGCEGFSIYSGVGTYSHSNFSEVLCNFGLIGFTLFYACYIIPFLYCFNGKEKDKYIVFVYVIYFLLKGFLGVSYYYKESFLIIAFCMFLTRDSKFIARSKQAKNNLYYETYI